jgi:hypothetical protein
MIDMLKKIKRTVLDYFTWFDFNLKKKKYYKNVLELAIEGSDVTVVITSCGREDHLDKMLESFFCFNDAPISNYILVEDAGSKKCVNVFLKYVGKYDHEIIFHENNLGQLISIDEAYSRVETKYVLHLEDDWLFIKPGFIQNSINLYRRHSNICSVSIRPHGDWSSDCILNIGGCYIILFPRNKVWGGIAINPGLYDMSKYNRIAPYSQYNKERKIALMYSWVGYRGVLSNMVDGYVVHAGDGYTTRKKYKVA